MHCPLRTCGSHRVKLYRTVRTQSELQIPAKYHGLNINRRQYKCLDCTYRFATVEITEPLFDELRVNSRVAGVGEIEQRVRKTNV